MPRQWRSVKNKAEIKCVAVYQSRTLLMILLCFLLCNALIICSRPLCSASKRSESKGHHEKWMCKDEVESNGDSTKIWRKKKYCETNKGCILQKWLSLWILTGMIWFPKINWETSQFYFGDEKKAAKERFIELEIQHIDLWPFVLIWLEFSLQVNKLNIQKLKEN